MRLLLVFVLSMFVVACGTSQQAGTGNTGSGTRGDATTNQAQRGPAPGTQAYLNQTIGDRVFFDTDRHNVDAEGRDRVQAWAKWLLDNPNVSVLIEGHADERGTRDYNFALGARRSYSVKSSLEAMGVDRSRIETTTFGKERPAALGSDPAAWAQNRRAVMVVKG